MLVASVGNRCKRSRCLRDCRGVALAVAALAIWLARGRRRLELRALAIGLLFVGVVTLVGVWFVGETGRAVQARRAALPTLQNRWATYGIAAAALLVRALIAPLYAGGWATTLVTAVLAIAGVEVIRTIVQREAQQETLIQPGAV